jgi:hypothetical protein
MNFEIIEFNGKLVAESITDEQFINTTQDALDLMGDCGYYGASRIILKKHNILPGFYDLKTGIAGEILQKFSTYDVRLAIIGDFSGISSRSMKDFIRESNKTGRILFAGTPDEGKERLCRS